MWSAPPTLLQHCKFVYSLWSLQLFTLGCTFSLEKRRGFGCSAFCLEKSNPQGRRNRRKKKRKSMKRKKQQLLSWLFKIPATLMQLVQRNDVFIDLFFSRRSLILPSDLYGFFSKIWYLSFFLLTFDFTQYVQVHWVLLTENMAFNHPRLTQRLTGRVLNKNV